MPPPTNSPRGKPRHPARKFTRTIPVLLISTALVALVVNEFAPPKKPFRLERVEIKVGSETTPTTRVEIGLFNESGQPIRIDPIVRLTPKPKEPRSLDLNSLQGLRRSFGVPKSIDISNRRTSSNTPTKLSMEFEANGFPSSLTRIDIDYFKPSHFRAISFVRSTIDSFLPEEHQGITITNQYFIRKTQSFHAEEILQVTSRYARESGYLFNESSR